MQRNVRASHLNVKNEVESVSHAYGLDEFSHFRVKIRHFMADYSHLQTTPQRVGGQKYMFKGVMGGCLGGYKHRKGGSGAAGSALAMAV